jgi:hypothetical protein
VGDAVECAEEVVEGPVDGVRVVVEGDLGEFDVEFGVEVAGECFGDEGEEAGGVGAEGAAMNARSPTRVAGQVSRPRRTAKASRSLTPLLPRARPKRNISLVSVW